jgi:PPOX class probable F420-dependent enzyme
VTPVDDAERSAFLARPLTAVVSTVGATGAPHAVPVWYRYDGEHLRVWTGSRPTWVGNLRRDPRASVTVVETATPHAAVLLYCTAIVATDEEWMAGEVRQIAERYLPAAAVDVYIHRLAKRPTVVTFTPDRIVPLRGDR